MSHIEDSISYMLTHPSVTKDLSAYEVKIPEYLLHELGVRRPLHMGWMCPRCGNCYSPYKLRCNCHKNKNKTSLKDMINPQEPGGGSNDSNNGRSESKRSQR